METSGPAIMSWPAAWAGERDARVEPLDGDAFRRLHERLAGPLVGYLARMTGREATAQETWLKLLSTPVDSSDPDRLRSFVFCIATNLARDLFRRRRRETLFGLRPRPGADSGPSRPTARAVETCDVERCLAVLGERDRALVLLAHVEGFDHREIGRIMNVNPDSS